MYFNIDDLSIYYEKYGNSNNSIVILPGWGNTRNTFYNMIFSLQENYTIYILDYPGFGNSSIPKADLDIYDYTKIIIKFLEHNNIINPIIISHSFGGRISTLLDGYFNIKINKLIMIDVAPIKKKSIYLKFKQSIYKLLKKVSFLLPNTYKNKYLNKLLSIFGSTDYKNIPITMRNTFKNIINEDLSKYLKNIKTNTLIIWGLLDKDTPIKHGRIINKKIKDSALITIPNSGHFPYLDYPILINNIIKEFLK